MAFHRAIFDIETVPLPDAADFLEPVEAPSNYKDPEKIAAYIAEERTKQLDRCSLDPDLCRVVAIGWWREIDAEPAVGSVRDETEAALLARFWQEVRGFHLVGYNVIGFDLPVLFRRSLYLGVEAPPLQVDRYRHPGVTDLQQLLSHHGSFRYRSLNFYCRRFGIDVPDELSGADIQRAVEQGRWGDVAHHAVADTHKTARIAGLMGHFNRTSAAA